jgi:hypothetical protein
MCKDAVEIDMADTLRGLFSEFIPDSFDVMDQNAKNLGLQVLKIKRECTVKKKLQRGRGEYGQQLRRTRGQWILRAG